ncbi:MAG: glycosyltransferase family 4 protein [Flavobacteriales bacterium]
MKRILVLYRELAGYFVQCINHLCDEYNMEADIIAYPVHADAPFQFSFSPRVKVFNRNDFDEESLVLKIEHENYDLIFVGGWADKTYLNALKRNSAVNSLLGFDTWYNGSLKQRMSAIYAQLKITPYFNVAFVPGAPQKQLALMMGFKENEIITGAYSCDTVKFSMLYESRLQQPPHSLKQLMYAGRYAPEKFIDELQQVFIEVVNEGEHHWQLLCVGTGPLFENRKHHQSIRHLGFLQPHQLQEAMKTADAFVLPSTFEPWGVVVHEFAAAGFPLVLSDNVGASEVFLEHEKSGFAFRSGDKHDLKQKLKMLFSKSDEELQVMGNKSHHLAQTITPDTWAKSLYQLMQ